MKLRKLSGTIYVRFLAAFIGTFLISLLIPAIYTNVAQAPDIRRNMKDGIRETSEKIKLLINAYSFTPAEAVRLMKTRETDIITADSLAELDSDFIESLSTEQLNAAKNGEVIAPPPSKEDKKRFSLFLAGGKWIYIHPNMQDNPLSRFMRTQFYFVAIPMLLGTILLFFTAITIARPIKKLSIASKRVALGDLTVQIDYTGRGEIRELTDNFNQMVTALSANEYLHKEFVSNVSHEFNTPITSLKGYAKLLKRTSLPEEKRLEYADIIIYESDRLSRLSGDLLRLSELEQKGKIEKKEPFSLDEQIRDAVILLQNVWEGKDLSLHVDLPDVLYEGDRTLLYQVWINLISNAVKYTEKSGTIRIVLEYGTCITVSIADTGIGMTDAQKEHIFSRFYKADQARNSPGTGLGLAIAKKIIELHGGTIQVESTLYEGTRFCVTLPLLHECF